MTADNSVITSHLKNHSKTAYKFTNVDVDAAATEGRFPRADAVRRLQQWNDSGAIELKQGGVINCFKVLQEFPKDDRVQNTVAGIVLQQFEEKEAHDMMRVGSVIDFVTTKGCLARELAKHFGDEDSVPITGCTTCNYCVTKKAVEYLPGDAKSEASNIDEKKIQAILAATSTRDDARFLARVAYGITSPRITAEKLSKNNVFGCMAKCNFEVSLHFIQSNALWQDFKPTLTELAGACHTIRTGMQVKAKHHLGKLGVPSVTQLTTESSFDHEGSHLWKLIAILVQWTVASIPSISTAVTRDMASRPFPTRHNRLYPRILLRC